MLKIETTKQDKFMDVCNVNDNTHVGIFFPALDRKISVVRTSKGSFMGIYGKDEDLKEDDCWTRATKQEYIKRAVDEQGAIPYAFNTFKELCAWIAE